MSGPTVTVTPNIGEVIQCLAREVERRRGYYPKLVERRAMYPRVANKEIICMERALSIIQRLALSQTSLGE